MLISSVCLLWTDLLTISPFSHFQHHPLGYYPIWCDFQCSICIELSEAGGVVMDEPTAHLLGFDDAR